MRLAFWRRDTEAKADVNDWPWSGSPPASWLFGWMPIDRAVGVPALLGVILRVGQGVGMVPQLVYQDGDLRERAYGSWQWDLLHRRPSSEATPFAFRADVATSLAASGYACVRKFKVPGRVAELMVLDADKVTPRRIGGRLVFEDRSGGGQTVVRTQQEIIYVRGQALHGDVKGLSPISAARSLFTSGIARLAFQQQHLTTGGRPDVVVKFPERLTAQQAKEYGEDFVKKFGGPENAGKAFPLGGGAELVTVPVSMQDAQFVESAQMTAQEIAGIYGVPKSFLGLGDQPPTELDWRFFVTFALGWITTAVDQAFSADEDLFPAGSGLFCESLPDALLRQDAKTRYDSYRLARQGGWISANEIRARENLPPVDGGDEVQVTPVGGAVNPALAKFDEDALLGELLARMRDSRELETTS